MDQRVTPEAENMAGSGLPLSAWPGRDRWDEINDRWHAGAKITDDEVGELLDMALAAGLEVERLRAALRDATDDIAALGRNLRSETGQIATWAHEIAVRSRRVLDPAP